MEDSEEDLIDLGRPRRGKERARKLERRNTQQLIQDTERETFKPPAFERTFTSPEVPSLSRPQLGQFATTSDEFIQRTRSGIMDLTGRGITSIQNAGNSVNDFRERMKKRESSWNALLRPPENDQMHASTSRGLTYPYSEGEDDGEEGSPPTSLKSQPESQLPESDRKEVCIGILLIASIC